MGQFTEEQAKTLKDAYKTDANQVLSSIMEKIRQLDGLSQGTELGDVLSGFSQMQKSMLAPFKIMTSGLNEVKKSFKNFKELAEEEKKSKDKNNKDAFDQSNNDLAKDESVLDLSEHIRNLIEQENVNLNAIEQSITEQHHFLQDIQNTVASLIYGTDAVVDQLRKNQKNTKVYQVSKKEMTLAEKAELSQGTTQIALLGNIQAQLEKLDEELTDSLVDAMDPQGQYQESLQDAEFPPLNDDKKTHQQNDGKKEDKKEEIGLLRKIGNGILNGLKFAGHMLKAGSVAAFKTLGILTIILGSIIGLDLTIAYIRTKWDVLTKWLQEKLNDFGNWVTETKKIMDDAFNKYVKEPFDRFVHYLVEIKTQIINLGARFLEGLAQIAEAAGKDDWAKQLNLKAAEMRIDAQIEKQQSYDDYVKSHGEEKAKNNFGDRPEVQQYKLEEGLQEKISELAKQDVNKGITDTLNNQEKTLIQLNTSIEDLNALYRQAISNGDKESAEKIDNFKKLKEKSDEVYKSTYDEDSIFKKFQNLFKQDEEVQKEEIELKEKAENSKQEFLEKYGIKKGQSLNIEIQRKAIDQIQENERQEYMMNDSFGGGIPYGYEHTKNNVQVNNQNNNTNVHSAPLSVNNPRQYKQAQQNIGTK